MIGKITGIAVHKDKKSVIIDVGGIGYKTFITTEDLIKIHDGKEYSLWTHLIVREDVLDLYGFFDLETKSFFELLIGVSGIGPKTALGILNIAPPKTLKQAIATQNTSYLTKVSGIGKKSAIKIVLELKDKLKEVETDGLQFLEEDQDTLLALRSLGYGAQEAREALREIPSDIVGTQERIREALKLLSK